MQHGLPAPDARGALRVPLDCKVRLRGIDGRSYYGVCADLSVTGLTVRTMFVPQEDELLDVCVLPPPQGGRTQPLSARARVVRCHAIDDELFELGLAIEEILG
ncbi:PilZ domain-containing protein [Jeongeupia wiesaeckerbachi]|uniref:PilZ domain-containing protein n=1 Tax=Jeongeupia wiesaeckerbachi TaxID=3051218 RepID=UPI003D8058C0